MTIDIDFYALAKELEGVQLDIEREVSDLRAEKLRRRAVPLIKKGLAAKGHQIYSGFYTTIWTHKDGAEVETSGDDEEKFLTEAGQVTEHIGWIRGNFYDFDKVTPNPKGRKWLIEDALALISEANAEGLEGLSKRLHILSEIATFRKNALDAPKAGYPSKVAFWTQKAEAFTEALKRNIEDTTPTDEG